MTTDEPVRVLVVDDNPDDATAIRRMLARYDPGFRIHAVASVGECVKRLDGEGADLLLLDYSLPGEDGLSFLRRLGEMIHAPPVIMVTGQGDERVAIEAVRSGAWDYLTKDQLTAEALGGAATRVLERFRADENLSRFDEQIMVALAAAAEGKDATTGDHLRRIAVGTMLLGAELGLEEDQLRVLRYGALLHDIGKLAVSTATLIKPGPLTAEEWDEIRQHTVVGERICHCLWLARQVGPVIRHHHERWDGGGYPDGLAGAAIPLLARIVSVVDAYDAMTSDRPYRKALPREQVARELRDGAGKQWDPEITHAFLSIIGRAALEPAPDGRPRRSRPGARR